MDRLEFQFSRRLRLFSKRQGYVTLGFVSLISWLGRACRLMPGAEPNVDVNGLNRQR